MRPGATCSVCGAAIGVHEVAGGGVCRTLGCMTVLALRARERARETRAAALAAAAATLDALGEEIAREPPVCVGAVPAFERRVAPADPDRLAAFRALLAKALAAASKMDAPLSASAEPPAAPAVRAALEAGCRVCEGLCCETGGNHAYLTAEELAGKLARDPSLTAEALYAAYVAHLPERSYEGSCVYHDAAGCVLPRPMRADICNSYRCRGLAELAAALEEAAVPRAWVAAVADGSTVRRAVLIEEGRAALERRAG